MKTVRVSPPDLGYVFGVAGGTLDRPVQERILEALRCGAGAEETEIEAADLRMLIESARSFRADDDSLEALRQAETSCCDHDWVHTLNEEVCVLCGRTRSAA